jgi:two-component system OmpR family response regulator
MDARKQNILVVEDNENTRRVLDAILRSSGYEVTLAPDAEEGLRVLREESVDLVLLDLILPGADGIQFLRSRATLDAERQPPVIVVSATEDMDTLRPQLRELGAKLALRKPFDVKELLAGVKHYATKRTAGPAARSAPVATGGRAKVKSKPTAK